MARKILYPFGLTVATIVGAGMFSLPFIFFVSGWGVGIVYLLVLGGVVAFAHDLYFRVVEKRGAHHGLFGLVQMRFGLLGRGAALFVVLGGLLLALVVYLILGAEFLGELFPALRPVAVFVFWALGSIPLFFGLSRFVFFEIAGGALMAAIILLVFVSALPQGGFRTVPFAVASNALLPFGAVLFSLAGWTVIEPVFALREKGARSLKMRRALIFGVFTAIALYLFFVFGIFGSAETITKDTLSGLSSSPAWEVGLLLVLGLFAIWTSYLPIAREIAHSLRTDIRWPAPLAVASTLVLPLLFYLAGLRDFIRAIGLAGGIFLSFQYLFIVLVAKKELALNMIERIAANAVVAAFLFAAFYEVYFFIH